MPRIVPALYVDADACPVKDETVDIATRHDLPVFMVSDGGIRPNPNPRVKMIFVTEGPDAADDWIAEHIEPGDICITSDIPLAARCIEKAAAAVKPNGDVFSEKNIGSALANRDLMQTLRETGEITGGPRPFSKADRSAFKNRLETLVQAARRQAN